MYEKFYIDRTEEIETLKEIINKRDYYKENSEKGISILINGSWGSGKSKFINDFCENMELDDKYKNYRILKYDAFEYDFYDNPFIPLFSFLHDALALEFNINRLAEITSKHIGTAVLKIAEGVASNFLKDKIGIDSKKLKKQFNDFCSEFNANDDVYNEFKEFNEIKVKIKEVIRDSVADGSAPIIFIIDELDRCNPVFAIRTLEILKYFLDIENFVIILSLDEKQLQESVKTIYGQGMNSDIYFSKFFDYKFNLNKLNFADIIQQESIADMPDIMPAINFIFNTLNVSIRDSHKIFNEFLSKYLKYNNDESDWTEIQCYFILFMLTLKNVDLKFYNSIMNLNFNNYRTILDQGVDVDNKKYIKVLGYKLYDGSNLEGYINNFTVYAYVAYIDLKFINYSSEPLNETLRSQRNALRNMHMFMPQVLLNKTYIENLHEILN